MENKKDFSMKIRKFLANDKVGAILIVVVMCLFLIITTEHFLTGRNIMTLLKQSSFYMIVVMGVLCVFMGGGMDLSTGATMCMSAIMTAMLAREELNLPIIVIILAAIVVGLVIGFINGFLIGYLNLPAFIETLGMSILLGGATLVITEGYSVNGLSEAFCNMGIGKILDIPIPVIVAVVMCIIMWFVLKKTRYGRHLAATGGNEQAAIVSGINTKRVKMFSYMLCSVFASIGGMLLCARFQSGQLSIGAGYELNAISAAVIGGASMTGGAGSVIGCVFGTFVLTILTNGLDILHVNAYWQNVVQGIVIIFAVLLDVIRHKIKDSIK
ncbi:MAG: ABC transporter permease [Parasporobacterium sp.]|nr:ABC transporter permease [Parasporobacterium sp.]